MEPTQSAQVPEKIPTRMEAEERGLLFSSDLNSQRLARLRNAVPEAFDDREVNWKLLQQLVEVKSKEDGMESLNRFFRRESREELIIKIEELEKDRKHSKKCGLVWEDYPEVIVAKCQKESPVLREVVSKEITTDQSMPTNLLIEGDNYHSLSVLNYTHKQKIDVIYIDPPYNTGAEDWKYNDKFVNKDDSYRHSKWLSMMEKRLLLAKNLLSAQGVIFISIDDNEQAHLKIMCDEIFGEKNFCEMFVWNKTATPPSLSKISRKNIEYILCYAKNISEVRKFFGRWSSNSDASLVNKGNKLKSLNFPKGVVKFNIPDGIYKREYKSESVNLITDVVVANNVNKNDFCLEAEFKWTQESLNKEISQKTYFIVKSNQFAIRYQRVGERKSFIAPDKYFDEQFLTKKAGIQTNEEARKTLEGMNIKFTYPKPVSLIKYLVRTMSKTNSTILDFFAGSGTTGHAVLELNKEDGGSRQFILCTNNENQIAEKITHRRIKNAIEGYTDNSKIKKNKVAKVGGLGGNLKYYKTAFVPGGSTDPEKRILSNKTVEMLCIRENTFQGVKTDSDKYKIYRNDKQHSVIILDDVAVANCKKEIAKIKDQCIVYLFSLSNEPDKYVFAEFGDRVQVKPIPEAILQIYRRIFR